MLNLYILFLLGSHVSATIQPPSLSGLQPSTPSEKEEESLEAFDRKVDGETVMKADPIPPRKINPGSTTFSDLAPPHVVVVPKSTRVHGVQWITGEDGGPGTIIFPDNFSGMIKTEIATHLYLKYYGAKMATDNHEPIDVHISHDQTTFEYSDDYQEKYVDGVVGASLERHNFCHTDRPEGHHSDSGHFVIGKFVDPLETVMDLTGFQVPQGQTIFIPGGVIHTNNYLLGRWNTMLATKENIDEVKMVKKGSAFSFTFVCPICPIRPRDQSMFLALMTRLLGVIIYRDRDLVEEPNIAPEKNERKEGQAEPDIPSTNLTSSSSVINRETPDVMGNGEDGDLVQLDKASVDNAPALLNTEAPAEITGMWRVSIRLEDEETKKIEQTPTGPLPDYPQSFTLQGNAATWRMFVGGNLHSQCLGLYRRMNLIQNGRPVWKLETGTQYLFFTGDKHWMFGRDYTRDSGFICSVSSGLLSLPSTGWRYALFGWKEDPSLRVTIE